MCERQHFDDTDSGCDNDRIDDVSNELWKLLMTDL